jgi:hypothetical protein
MPDRVPSPAPHAKCLPARGRQHWGLGGEGSGEAVPAMATVGRQAELHVLARRHRGPWVSRKHARSSGSLNFRWLRRIGGLDGGSKVVRPIVPLLRGKRRECSEPVEVTDPASVGSGPPPDHRRAISSLHVQNQASRARRSVTRIWTDLSHWRTDRPPSQSPRHRRIERARSWIGRSFRSEIWWSSAFSAPVSGTPFLRRQRAGPLGRIAQQSPGLARNSTGREPCHGRPARRSNR